MSRKPSDHFAVIWYEAARVLKCWRYFALLILVVTNRYIVNYNSFIAILGMFGSSNNHFRISISNLKPRKVFSLKCFLPGNVVADLNIKLLVASLSNKVDFLLIELADINII